MVEEEEDDDEAINYPTAAKLDEELERVKWYPGMKVRKVSKSESAEDEMAA